MAASISTNYTVIGRPIRLSGSFTTTPDDLFAELTIYKAKSTYTINTSYPLGIPEANLDYICTINAPIINNKFSVDLHDIFASYVDTAAYYSNGTVDQIYPKIATNAEYYGNSIYLEDGSLFYTTSPNIFVMRNTFVVSVSTSETVYHYNVNYSYNRYNGYGDVYTGMKNFPIVPKVYTGDVLPITFISTDVPTGSSTSVYHLRYTAHIQVPKGISTSALGTFHGLTATDGNLTTSHNTTTGIVTIHGDLINSGTAGTISGFIQIDPIYTTYNNEFYFAHDIQFKYVTEDNGSLGTTPVYTIINDCRPKNTYMLYYVNPYGAIDYAYFDCKNTKKITKSSTTMVGNGSETWTYLSPYKFGERNISSSNYYQYTLNTDWLLDDYEDEQFTKLEDRIAYLVQTDKAWLLDSRYGMRAVNITDNTIELKKNSDERDLFNLTLNVKDSISYQTKQF